MCQCADKILSAVGRQMLGDFEALHQIKAPTEVYRLAQVRGAKLARADHQPTLIDIGAIHAEHTGAGFLPDAQPSSLATAKVRHALDRRQSLHRRNDMLCRPDGKGRQETVEPRIVFVHFALAVSRRCLAASAFSCLELCQRLLYASQTVLGEATLERDAVIPALHAVFAGGDDGRKLVLRRRFAGRRLPFAKFRRRASWGHDIAGRAGNETKQHK
jgi:hypothetical protein